MPLTATALSPEHLDAFAALHGNPPWIARLRERTDLSHCRVLLDDQGVLAAAMLADAGGHYVLTEPVTRPGAPVDLGPLLDDVLACARSRGIEGLGTRIDRERLSPAFAAALSGRGFARTEERACWRAPVSALPDERGTPLSWTVEPDLAAATALLGRASAGDPDWTGEPADELRGWLADPVLVTDSSVVQVGAHEGRPVAFACAQVNPRSAWGRITYVGVVPEARGRGLGAWAHRRGFAMLRAQGATHYEGGTATANAAMNRLFEKHGCERFRVEIGWRWRSGS